MTEKYKKFSANGYWLDQDDKRLGAFFGMVISPDEWDGVDDDEDSKIFYYTDGEPLLGKHSDFEITEIEEY